MKDLYYKFLCGLLGHRYIRMHSREIDMFPLENGEKGIEVLIYCTRCEVIDELLFGE